MKKPVRVLVEWKDICTTSEYWDGEDQWGVMKCFTYGILVKRDKKQIMIAQTVCEDGSYGGVLTIPAEVVLRVIGAK